MRPCTRIAPVFRRTWAAPSRDRRSDRLPKEVKSRLDRAIVDRSLAESREKAQALIMAGEVLVDGQKASKAGQLVSPEARIEVTAKQRYVGRGGLKLEGALREFGIDVTGLVAADFGSSTGGFTDCLLQSGAVR